MTPSKNNHSENPAPNPTTAACKPLCRSGAMWNSRSHRDTANSKHPKRTVAPITAHHTRMRLCTKNKRVAARIARIVPPKPRAAPRRAGGLGERNLKSAGGSGRLLCSCPTHARSANSSSVVPAIVQAKSHHDVRQLVRHDQPEIEIDVSRCLFTAIED